MTNLNILRANLTECFTAYCDSILREIENMYPDGKVHGTGKYEVKFIERRSATTGRKLKPLRREIPVTEPNTAEWRAAEAAEKINRLTSMRVMVEPVDSCTYISLKGETEDTFFTDANITLIINRIPEKYRSHLIGFRPEYANYFTGVKSFGNAVPVFEGDWDKMFWDEYHDYINKKAAWCSKYGCD